MKLNAPKQVVWIIAVVVGVLGILASVVPITALVGYSFWMVAIGFLLLALSTAVKGM